LLIQLLETFPTEDDIENFFSGLGSLWVDPAAVARRWGGIPASDAAQALVHQGSSTSNNRRKANQISNSQKVIHQQLLFPTL
jgi:hypothetical protein